MTSSNDPLPGRRALLKTAGVFAGALVVPGAVTAGMKIARPRAAPAVTPRPAPAFPSPRAARVASSRVVRPELLKRALAALDRHSPSGLRRDRIVIADFAAPSSQARFHIVDLANGKSTSLLVAHGSGSDPRHSGWLTRFSNAFDSNASCEGAFFASDYYVGKHGRSQRLVGLDATNSNALDRAIVVHGAWYANAEMIRTHGRLGRSQGCFAVGESELAGLFDRLGTKRMIYAAKV